MEVLRHRVGPDKLLTSEGHGDSIKHLREPKNVTELLRFFLRYRIFLNNNSALTNRSEDLWYSPKYWIYQEKSKTHSICSIPH